MFVLLFSKNEEDKAPISCLLSRPKFTACDWKDFPSRYFHHFGEKHGDCVMQPQDGSFVQHLTSDNDFTWISLLNVRNEKIFIYANIDVEERKLWYTLCTTMNGDNSEKIEPKVILKYSAVGNDTIAQIEGSIQPMRYLFDQNLRSNVDLFDSPIWETTSNYSPKVTCTVTFKLEDSSVDEVQHREIPHLESLTCPTCLSLLRPPIYLCQDGHNICSLFRMKITNCYICNKEFNGARNGVLEKIIVASKIRFPCFFQNYGCMEMDFYDKISEHEPVCPKKHFDCPICKVPLGLDIEIHFTKEHFGDFIKFHENLNIWKTCYTAGREPIRKPVYFINFNRLFRLICFDSAVDYSLICLELLEIYSNPEILNRFNYDIMLEHNQFNGWKGVKSRYCVPIGQHRRHDKECFACVIIKSQTYKDLMGMQFYFTTSKRSIKRIGKW